MRRVSFALLALCIMVCMPSAVLASSPHYIKGPTCSIDTTDGSLVCAFKEAGLDGTPVTYSLIPGEAIFTFQCFTKSGNEPQGEPNSISFSKLSEFITLTPRNGQITGSISLAPQQDGADCQGNGLVLKLLSVQYNDAVFTDETNTALGFEGLAVDVGSFGFTFPSPITP